MALRKYEHVIAAVHGLASMGKAAPESRAARQWKDIEKRRDQPVFEGSEKIQQPVALVARVPPILKHLTGHGDGNLSAHRSGQRVENQCCIERSDVVCDQQERLVWRSQLAAARDRGVSKKPDQRAHYGLQEHDSHRVDSW